MNWMEWEMYRLRFDFDHRAVLAMIVFAVVMGGCAAPGTHHTGPLSESPAASAQSADAVERRGPPALVQVDEDVGFTVTEVVSMGSDVRADYREAVRLLGQDDYARGIALLIEVTAREPGATAPLVDLGIAYSLSGALTDAETTFRAALALTQDHPVAHNELGIVYRKLGRFEEARESYARALAIFPGFHYARRNLAVLCDLYLGDVACALEHYEVYRKAVPDDREVEIWIGDIRNRISAAE